MFCVGMLYNVGITQLVLFWYVVQCRYETCSVLVCCTMFALHNLFCFGMLYNDGMTQLVLFWYVVQCRYETCSVLVCYTVMV